MDKMVRVMSFLVTIETPGEVTIDGAETLVKDGVKAVLPKDIKYITTNLHSIQYRKEPMIGYPKPPDIH